MARCNVKSCIAPARFQPMIQVWAVGWLPGEHPPAEIEVGLEVCQTHRIQMVLGDILGTEGKTVVGDAFRKIGRADPDWSTAKLGFRDIPLEV